MKLHVLLGVAMLVACGGPDTSTEILRGTGSFPAQLEVPRAAAAASQAHVDRLRASLLRRDPAATAGVWGRELARGAQSGAAYVFLLEHSRTYADGTALTDVARDIETQLDSEGTRRGITTTIEDTRGERHIDMAYSLGEGALVTRVRLRIFIADRLYEVGCMCSGPMCSVMATCTLPDPPPGALPIDQVMRAGR